MDQDATVPGHGATAAALRLGGRQGEDDPVIAEWLAKVSRTEWKRAWRSRQDFNLRPQSSQQAPWRHHRPTYIST